MRELASWFFWLMSFLPMGAWWFIAAIVLVAVWRVPAIGSLKLAVAAAAAVMIAGWGGDIYSMGDEGGLKRGYRLGHADGLKGWKPDPQPAKRAGKPEKYTPMLERAQEAVKPRCVERKNSHLPDAC